MNKLVKVRDETEDLHCILYISTMEIDYSKNIKSMLKLFQKNNKENNISGLMLYCESNIIQYIEGDKKDLYSLYNKIENDNRHYNIIKIMDERIIKRNFVNWELGFKELSYIEFKNFSLDQLILINNNFDLNQKKIKIFFKQFLSSFIKYN